MMFNFLISSSVIRHVKQAITTYIETGIMWSIVLMPESNKDRTIMAAVCLSYSQTREDVDCITWNLNRNRSMAWNTEDQAGWCHNKLALMEKYVSITQMKTIGW